MNKMIAAVATVALTTLSGAAFAKTIYVAADDSVETRLCVSAATDSKIAFYETAKDSGLSLRTIARSLSCNDESVINFAQNAGKFGTAQRLASYVRGHVELKEVAEAAPADDKGATRIVYIRGR